MDELNLFTNILGRIIMLIDWLLDKLGYNFRQKQKILKVIWKVMAVVFGCAMIYGIYAMVLDIAK